MGNTSTPSAPTYATVTSSNPYATATAGAFGSTYTLNDFLTKQNKTIEETVPQLYQRLLNPTLDDTVSQARIQAFQKTFNTQSQQAFENNLINPLSERNMLRSSLLNDLSKNYQETQASQIADFSNELLSNSLSDTQSMISSLMNQYATNSNFGKTALSFAQKDLSSLNSFNMNVYEKQLQDSWNSNKLTSQWLGSNSTKSLMSLLPLII